MFKAAQKNVKTTIVGIVSLVLAVLVALNVLSQDQADGVNQQLPLIVENIDWVISAVFAILGLLGITAKDGDQTGLPTE